MFVSRLPRRLIFLLLGTCWAACQNGASLEGNGVSSNPATPSNPTDAGDLLDVSSPSDNYLPTGDGSTSPRAPSWVSELVTLRLAPADAQLQIGPEASANQEYRLLAELEGQDTAVDITESAVFYVSHNHLVGAFTDNGPTFETSADAPRGGYAEVTALVSGQDGEVLSATTGLTIVMDAELPATTDGAGELPENPGDYFAGQGTPAQAPTIVYPNDGVLLPPNLNELEVHFRPQSGQTLFELNLSSPVTNLHYFSRCNDSEGDQDGGCTVSLSGAQFDLLADANRGGLPVAITVAGVSNEGTQLGVSEAVHIQFSDTDVQGGLYYWTTSQPVSIMRLDFGAAEAAPEVFLSPNQNGMGGTCVGCHAISPDGRRVVASLGGQKNGNQVLVNDLSTPQTDPSFLDRSGQAPADLDDKLQFASFNPDGSQFVAIYGDYDEQFQPQNIPENATLWFHDGETGERIPGAELRLDFEPSHPDWSPDGNMILMSRVGGRRIATPSETLAVSTSQRPVNCGISRIVRDGDGWSEAEDILPVIYGDGISRYNPDLLPNGEFFVFSESHCLAGQGEVHGSCDGDADPSAKTWVARPEPGAEPIFLAHAAQPGIEDDGQTDLTDTFPRSSPFEGYYRPANSSLGPDAELRPVYWITIASERRVGLRNARPAGASNSSLPHQQLWMFAIDPTKLAAGEDGSFPAFHLPFQDRTTDNHIAQWTKYIVDDEPNPEPPEPPAAPTPPTPPAPR